MSVVAEILNEIAFVAALLDRKGWADSHSGNLSFIVNKQQIIHLPEQYFLSEIISLPVAFPAIDGCFIAITGTGTRMRDVARSAEENVVWLQVAERGETIRLYNYNRILLKPTSEFIAHLGLYNSTYTGNNASIVHTHVPEITAVTHNPKFCSEEELCRILWKMQPEGVITFPEGLGFISYYRTGSVELAKETALCAKRKKVIIWEKHGILAHSKNAESALDLIETVSGAFKLYLTCLSAGFEPEGLTTPQIEELLRYSIQKGGGL